jgi:tol-pal system protein YbgF
MKTYARHARRLRFYSGVVCICIFGFFTANVAARQAAPIIEGTASTPQKPSIPEVRLSFEERLSRIERRLDNDAMADVMRQIDFLQQDMRRLVGEMELVNHEIDGIKKRQRELYLDIDRRLNQMTQKIDSMSASPTTPSQAPTTGPNATASSAANNASAAPSGVGPSTAADTNISRDAYERAFNLLKEGRYELAIAAFKAFIETYPTASYADNAQYWLGEANYAKQNYKVALQEFNKVLDNYPQSAKIPDAMLKIGYCYAELGNSQQATVVLNNIISHYPDSTAARLATKRLTILKN